MATSAGGRVSQHSFARAPGQSIPRSTFDRSRGRKLTLNGGELTPIFVDELLPGDTINSRESLFGRLTTQIVPVLHPMYVETFYFGVPVRLLWENWEKFHGAQEDPGDSIDFETPIVTIPAGGFAEDGLWDHLGVPPQVEYGSEVPIQAFWQRAYKLIWNEWFRDQDLQDSLTVETDDGPDTAYDTLLKRGKRHDYFTAARPWPVKGGVEITIPLGTSAPVTISGNGDPTFTVGGTTGVNLESAGSSTFNVFESRGAGGADASIGWDDPALTGTADLTAASASTINELREAFAMQHVIEIDARSGTRYVETLKAHFGVHPPDFRLMRPEFLGGGRTEIAVNPVAETFQEIGVGPVYNNQMGNLGAFATAASNKGGFVYSAVEHMVVIGFACLRADLVYQQGVHRMFTRRDRYDYYLPSLAHLGEQVVNQYELYADGTTQDDDVFGYQERWAEYRYAPSTVTGTLRSSHSSSLDVWHLGLDFDTAPALNSTFIEENPPLDRILIVDQSEEPAMRLDVWHSVTHARPMPTHSVPGLERL